MGDYELAIPVMCSECMDIRAFYLPAHALAGKAYECKCGLVMRVNDDLSTTRQK